MIYVQQIEGSRYLPEWDTFYTKIYCQHGVKACLEQNTQHYFFKIQEEEIADWEDLAQKIKPLILQRDYQKYILPKLPLRNVSVTEILADIAENTKIKDKCYHVEGNICDCLDLGEGNGYLLAINENQKNKPHLWVKLTSWQYQKIFGTKTRKEVLKRRLSVIGCPRISQKYAEIQLQARKAEDIGENTRLTLERQWRQNFSFWWNSERPELLAKLQQEGFQTVGLVTREKSEAQKDFMQRLLKRRHFTAEDILLKSCSMSDASQIASAIDTLAEKNLCDVICVVRGGGDPDDLFTFSQPEIIRAVYDAIHLHDTPVIVGIGHTGNEVLVNKVASHDAGTPSFAADFLNELRNRKSSQERRNQTARAFSRQSAENRETEANNKKLVEAYNKLQAEMEELKKENQQLQKESKHWQEEYMKIAKRLLRKEQENIQIDEGAEVNSSSQKKGIFLRYFSKADREDRD